MEMSRWQEARFSYRTGTWAPRVGRLVGVQRDDVQDGQTGEDPDPFHLTVHVGLHIRSSVRIDERPAS